MSSDPSSSSVTTRYSPGGNIRSTLFSVNGRAKVTILLVVLVVIACDLVAASAASIMSLECGLIYAMAAFA